MRCETCHCRVAGKRRRRGLTRRDTVQPRLGMRIARCAQFVREYRRKRGPRVHNSRLRNRQCNCRRLFGTVRKQSTRRAGATTKDCQHHGEARNRFVAAARASPQVYCRSRWTTPRLFESHVLIHHSPDFTPDYIRTLDRPCPAAALSSQRRRKGSGSELSFILPSSMPLLPCYVCLRPFRRALDPFAHKDDVLLEQIH